MKVNMNNYSQSFNGLLLFQNKDAKMYSTINTQNIIGIRQKYNNTSTLQDYPTDIIVKNTFNDNPYLIYSFDMPVKDVIVQYNKACKNENAELGRLNNISFLNAGL